MRSIGSEVAERSREFIDRHRHKGRGVYEVPAEIVCNWTGHDSERVMGKLKSDRVMLVKLVNLV